MSSKPDPVLVAMLRRNRKGLPKQCTGWNGVDGILHDARLCPVHDVACWNCQRYGTIVADDLNAEPRCTACNCLAVEPVVESVRCLICQTPLTADDPVVTTLGPRCARHF